MGRNRRSRPRRRPGDFPPPRPPLTLPPGLEVVRLPNGRVALVRVDWCDDPSCIDHFRAEAERDC